MLRHLDYPPIWLLGGLLLLVLEAWLRPGAASGETLASAGVTLIVAGGALMGAAAWQFRRHRTTIVPHREPSALITTGVYGFSRNPIYLGDALVLAGAGALVGAWSTLLVVPAFVRVINRRFIAPEEARLARAFGPAYEDWAARVRRWV